MNFLIRKLNVKYFSPDSIDNNYEVTKNKEKKTTLDKAAILKQHEQQQKKIEGIRAREQQAKKQDDPENFLSESLSKVDNNHHRFYINENTGSQKELLKKKGYVFENGKIVGKIVKGRYMFDNNGNVTGYIKKGILGKKWVIDDNGNKKAYIDKKGRYHSL